MNLIKYLKYVKYILFFVTIFAFIYVARIYSPFSMNVIYEKNINLSDTLSEKPDSSIDNKALIDKSTKILSKLLDSHFDSADYNILTGLDSDSFSHKTINLSFKNKHNTNYYNIGYNINSGELLYIRVFEESESTKTSKLSKEEMDKLAFSFLLKLPLPSPEGIKKLPSAYDYKKTFFNSITEKLYYVHLDKYTGKLQYISVISN